MITKEQWEQRFIGAYMALAECDEAEAEEALGEGVTLESLDTDNDCPVATARELWDDTEIVEAAE
ncbi:MAG: hypothetical protein V3V97_16485 [Hyphomicrobiaceae bacterium]